MHNRDWESYFLLTVRAYGHKMGSMRLTQSQIAKQLGIDQTHVSKMLNGKRTPSPALAGRLAEAFGGHPWDWVQDPAKMLTRILETGRRAA